MPLLQEEGWLPVIRSASVDRSSSQAWIRTGRLNGIFSKQYSPVSNVHVSSIGVLSLVNKSTWTPASGIPSDVTKPLTQVSQAFRAKEDTARNTRRNIVETDDFSRALFLLKQAAFMVSPPFLRKLKNLSVLELDETRCHQIRFHGT